VFCLRFCLQTPLSPGIDTPYHQRKVAAGALFAMAVETAQNSHISCFTLPSPA